MPFTLAHPCAVLPIHSGCKRWFSLASLVVGSMVPDAAYYLPLPHHFRENAHTWLGAPFFSVPAGLMLLLAFYWVAPELAFLFPSPHREALTRAIKLPDLSLGTASLAVCGIVIGAESHVTWDPFTHRDGWMVERIPFLRVPVAGIHPYFVLQVLSWLVGLSILLYVYDRWARTQGYRAWTLREFSWRSLLRAGVLWGCFVAALAESHTIREISRIPFPESRRFAVVLTTSFIRNLLLALCALAMCLKLLSRRSRINAPYSSENSSAWR